ncbi:MAG: DUF2911 domain-containing protein [Fulvivirga sp.]|uniref:DUF2911 domain-containing protein n=1 Tax=Fulvivirga sp. TaxID=1931237 RepID=UPI0032EFE0FF
MKKQLLKYSIFSLLLVFIVSQSIAQGIVFTPQVSGAASVSQHVGITNIEVKYSRPNVVSPQGQDRTDNLWGSPTVPYGFTNLGFGTATEAPWRAGANENTIITFSTDVKVEGKDLKAGSYGLHIAVYEDNKATVIFSNDTQSWGSYFYNPENDALRVDITTQEVAQTDLLTYTFIEATTSDAVLALDWEKKRFPIKISADTPELVYQNFKEKLKGDQGFNIQSWMAAANYLAQNKIHLDDALNYANAAVEGQFFSDKNFNTLAVKAGVLVAMEKMDEAEKVMDEALTMQGVTINNYYAYGRQLISQDRKEKAMEIFKKASKKWSDHWLAPHGLARVYSAMGEYKKAAEYETKAIAKAPEASKPVLEGYLNTLKEGKDFN